MASQNMDPAAAAASSTAALKGSDSGGSAARGSVSKRCVCVRERLFLLCVFILGVCVSSQCQFLTLPVGQVLAGTLPVHG